MILALKCPSALLPFTSLHFHCVHNPMWKDRGAFTYQQFNGWELVGPFEKKIWMDTDSWRFPGGSLLITKSCKTDTGRHPEKPKELHIQYEDSGVSSRWNIIAKINHCTTEWEGFGDIAAWCRWIVPTFRRRYGLHFQEWCPHRRSAYNYYALGYSSLYTPQGLSEGDKEEHFDQLH